MRYNVIPGLFKAKQKPAWNERFTPENSLKRKPAVMYIRLSIARREVSHDIAQEASLLISCSQDLVKNE